MVRFLALALSVLAASGPALAQSLDDALVGTWRVERYTDAEPRTDDSLLPDNPYLATFSDLWFEQTGDVRVTLTVVDREGYAVRDLTMPYRLDGDRLAVDLDGLELSLTASLDAGALVLANGEGEIRLHRVPGG